MRNKRTVVLLALTFVSLFLLHTHGREIFQNNICPACQGWVSIFTALPTVTVNCRVFGSLLIDPTDHPFPITLEAYSIRGPPVV